MAPKTVIADLHPALGLPTEAGPCYVVDRIEQNVSNPGLRDRLERVVEQGGKLDNASAAMIYRLNTERGPGGFIQRIEISPHAQYRMDLRGITVPELRMVLKDFQKQLNDWRSQKSAEWAYIERMVNTGQPFEYEHKRSGIFMAMLLPSQGVARVVTVYWKGLKDPKPPGECPQPHIHHEKRRSHQAGYRTDDLSGQQTYVKKPGTQPIHQHLPTPPWKRQKPVGKPEYNTPGWSGTGPDGKSIHKDRVRTPGTPGERRKHPDPAPRNGPARKPVEGSIEVVLEGVGFGTKPAFREGATFGKPYPGTDRQHDTKGQAKSYYRRWYRRNKGKIKLRMTRWYRRYKNHKRFQKDQERRDKRPHLFERRPGGGVKDIAEKQKKYREQKRTAEAMLGPLPFFHVPSESWGRLLGVSELTGYVTFEVGGLYRSLGLDEFFDQVIFEGDAQETFLAYLDEIFRFGEDDEDEDWADIPDLDEGLEWGRTAEMLYEKQDRGDDPENRYDRAQDRKRKKDRREPGQKTLPQPFVEQNPGSAKVIPEGHGNKGIEKFRVAVLIREIEATCDDQLHEKAREISVRLRRVDAGNAMWLFDVESQSGKDPYRVRLQAIRRGNVKDVGKVHVRVSCSCPHWRWQGPEHWGKTMGYLYGKPRGTASFPIIRDPPHQHGACKHLLAVFRHVIKNSWQVPHVPGTRGKRGSDHGFRYLADSLLEGEVRMVYTVPAPSVNAVAGRYLELMGGRS